MSHVKFKKCQCPLSLEWPCPMSPLICSRVACRFQEIPHVVSLILFLMSLGSICRMSILRNAHVAVSNLGVEGHNDWENVRCV